MALDATSKSTPIQVREDMTFLLVHITLTSQAATVSLVDYSMFLHFAISAEVVGVALCSRQDTELSKSLSHLLL